MQARFVFKTLRDQTIEFLDGIVPLVEDVYGEAGGGEHTPRQSHLRARVKSLREEEFVVVVLGEIKRGKSTFLNVLLERPFLAWDVLESTATVSFLRHNETAPEDAFRNSAVVYFRDDRAREVVTRDDLAHYTSRQSVSMNVAETVAWVDLYDDNRFLEDRVTLVDTPGVNSIHPNHVRITYDQIERSNAAVFLFNASAAVSNHDVEFLGEIKDKIQRFFFVVNRIDQIALTDTERVLNHVRKEVLKMLGGDAGTKSIGVYGISSLKALLGKYGYFPNAIIPESEKGRVDDPDFRARLLDESGFIHLESDLVEYLFKGGKAQDMLRSPLTYATSFLETMRRDVAEQIRVLKGEEDIGELVDQERALENKLQVQKEELRRTSGALVTKLQESMERAYEDLLREFQLKGESLKDILNGYTSYDHLKDDWEEGECLSSISERQIQKIAVQAGNRLERAISSVLRAEDVRIRGKLSQELSRENVFTLSDLPSFSLAIKVPPSFEDEEKEMREARSKLDEAEHKLGETVDVDTNLMDAELKRLEQARARLNEEHIARLQLLGARPAVERHEYQQVEKQEREGAWGKFVNWLKGPKESVRVVTVLDDSSRREYDAKSSAIEKEFESVKAKLESEIALKHGDLSREQQEQLRLKRLRKLREQADEAHDKVRKRYEEKVETARSLALDASKKAIMRCYESGCDDLGIRLQAAVKQAGAIAEEYVQSLATEIDEVIRDLHSDLDRVRNMRSAKESEKTSLLANLNDVSDRIAVCQETATDIVERLRLFFAESNFSDQEGL